MPQSQVLIPHSNKSAISAFSLPTNGSLNKSSQTIYPTSNITGPILSRQNDSYSHHVILDPTHQYILIPDLGADLIRVFTYTSETVAPLIELEPLKTENGAGPRHGVFWQARGKSGKWYLLFNGELSQKMYSYKIEYALEGGLKWEKVFEMPVLGELGKTLPPNTAPTSEVAVSVSMTSAFIPYFEVQLQSRELVLICGYSLIKGS